MLTPQQRGKTQQQLPRKLALFRILFTQFYTPQEDFKHCNQRQTLTILPSQHMNDEDSQKDSTSASES